MQAAFPGARHLLAALAVAIGLAAAAPARATEAPGKTYLLAVGICPPYRTDIAVAVCANSVKAVVDNFGDAFRIPKENIVALTDEKATGPGFLAALADLGRRMTATDRLILYLNLHGDSFGLWSSYYGAASGTVGEVGRRFYADDDYVLVFWTKEEPKVPLLALAEKDWLTVEEVMDAIDALPGKVALILDSCSSGRSFAGFNRAYNRQDQIDFLLVSAGAEQVANVNVAKTMPVFTEMLTSALDLPMVDTFGEAVAHARMATVLQATAICSTTTFDTALYAVMFPGRPVPNTRTHDGQVAPPLWLCAQVPSVADFSGEMSAMPVFRGPAQ